MEINLKKLGEQAVESTTGQKKMRLSENASSMVFQLFTKNVYSNPIGTVVREIASNCFDSHTEAKVNAPVLIKMGKDAETNSSYISFIDYGVGMSPDRVENIYGVYFESTKRIDNTQIGGFGIGGKTPLAYKRSTGQGEGEYDNSFYVITNFDSMRYFYCIYEGAESPVISLLHSEPTTERNGTEIRVPILDKDKETFAKEMVRQLYYFENVVFEGFDDTYRAQTLMNEYQIVRGKSFLFRGQEYADYMHVCLGRVAYPLDFNTLGLNSSDYRLPIAVRLEVGDIGVTVSRESLDYSEATIKMLKKKLELAKDEIKELIAKQYQSIVTLEDYFNVKSNFGKLNFSNGASINVGNIIKQSDVDFSNFKYQFMKMPNDKQLYRFFFNSKTFGKKPRRSRYSSSEFNFEGSYEAITGHRNLLYIEDEFIRKIVKQAYLKSLYEMYHIIEKRNLCDASMRHEISELFNVAVDKLVDDNGKPIPYVQSLLDMQEEYFDIIRRHAKDYDALEVPDDFVMDRKRNAMSKEMRNTTIPVKFIGGHSKYRIKLENLFDYDCPIFYGNQADESALYQAYNLFCVLFDTNAPVTYYSDYDKQFENRRSGKAGKKTIMFIVLAENNLKYMQYCKKAYKVDQFFRKILYRKETVVKQYFQTFGLVDRFKQIDDLYTSKMFAKVSPLWANDIADLTAKIQAIPEKARESSIGNYKEELSKYFDLSDVSMTKDQKKIAKEIDNVLVLQAMNEKILECINMPYRYDRDAVSDELISVLQKVMVL